MRERSCPPEEIRAEGSEAVMGEVEMGEFLELSKTCGPIKREELIVTQVPENKYA